MPIRGNGPGITYRPPVGLGARPNPRWPVGPVDPRKHTPPPPVEPIPARAVLTVADGLRVLDRGLASDARWHLQALQQGGKRWVTVCIATDRQALLAAVAAQEPKGIDGRVVQALDQLPLSFEFQALFVAARRMEGT